MSQNIVINGNNFELISQLGKGTYGSVFLIKIKDDLKAIKIITNRKEDGIKSLVEINTMSQLNHANLIKTEGIIVGVNNDITLGLIMPVANTDLQRLIKQPYFELSQQLKIMHGVLEGLNFLHQNEYLHLDLKLMNILIFNEGNDMVPKITDFGLTRKMENGIKYYPLELVTITHRSPEILNGDYNYTVASDIWALGIIFIEVFSKGKVLYPKITKTAVKSTIKKLLSSHVIDIVLNEYLSNIKLNIKYDIINTIKKMLDFDPRKRPHTEELMKSKLFNGLTHYKNIGTITNKRPKSPRECDIIYYHGFDLLVRMALKLNIKLETFFLANDIYQRSLAYAHKLTGVREKDWPNVSLISATSIYMAFKFLESHKISINKISNLAGDVFNSSDIIQVEASLVQIFDGIIYSKNLFTETNSLFTLIQIFEYLRNCYIYNRIDLDTWKSQNINKPADNKSIMFNHYFQKTKYYNLMIAMQPEEYLFKLYTQDTKE